MQNLVPRDYSKRIHMYTQTKAPAHTSILTIQTKYTQFDQLVTQWQQSIKIYII